MLHWNRTKIVATIGPASSKRSELRAMVLAGADVFRINGAHGDTAEHRRSIRLVRDVSRKMGVTLSILYDLPGPKMRLGSLAVEPRTLKKGEKVVLACGKLAEEKGIIPVPDKFISKSVAVGSRIFINDGIVELVVDKVNGNLVHCRVVAGGEIRSRKGINIPRGKLKLPSLTKRDRILLKFAMTEGVDYVGLSFVRSAANVTDLRRLMGSKSRIGIVAKIEKPEAVDDIEELIAVSDAIMVARGDLGIEMPFDEIPIVQKKILALCLALGKPSITATQMMESMINSSRPTRAEAADVAMAVWEGTDAVMLSAETSIGRNPAKAVSAMARVAAEAEKEMPDFSPPKCGESITERQAHAISFAAGLIADEIGAKMIVSPTRSGRTPLIISGTRPRTPVIALTSDEKVLRKMNLYWGVRPMKMPKFKTVDEMLVHAGKVALSSGLIKRGDRIVVVSGAHGTKGEITTLVEVRSV